ASFIIESTAKAARHNGVATLRAPHGVRPPAWACADVVVFFAAQHTRMLRFLHPLEVAMSDTKGGPDWAGDWQAVQRQYWTAWSDLARQQTAGPEPRDPSTPWQEGLEKWARMFGNAGKQTETAERLMAGAKDYLNLMQSMLAFAAGNAAAVPN